jgi:DNA-binding IclR family transcriptional regulator
MVDPAIIADLKEQILDVLKEYDQGLDPITLAREVDLPVNSVYRLLIELDRDQKLVYSAGLHWVGLVREEE